VQRGSAAEPSSRQRALPPPRAPHPPTAAAPLPNKNRTGLAQIVSEVRASDRDSLTAIKALGQAARFGPALEASPSARASRPGAMSHSCAVVLCADQQRAHHARDAARARIAGTNLQPRRAAPLRRRPPALRRRRHRPLRPRWHRRRADGRPRRLRPRAPPRRASTLGSAPHRRVRSRGTQCVRETWYSVDARLYNVAMRPNPTRRRCVWR
jgi:hypothetical protein